MTGFVSRFVWCRVRVIKPGSKLRADALTSAGNDLHGTGQGVERKREAESSEVARSHVGAVAGVVGALGGAVYGNLDGRRTARTAGREPVFSTGRACRFDGVAAAKQKPRPRAESQRRGTFPEKITGGEASGCPSILPGVPETPFHRRLARRRAFFLPWSAGRDRREGVACGAASSLAAAFPRRAGWSRQNAALESDRFRVNRKQPFEVSGGVGRI